MIQGVQKSLNWSWLPIKALLGVYLSFNPKFFEEGISPYVERIINVLRCKWWKKDWEVCVFGCEEGIFVTGGWGIRRARMGFCAGRSWLFLGRFDKLRIVSSCLSPSVYFLSLAPIKCNNWPLLPLPNATVGLCFHHFWQPNWYFAAQFFPTAVGKLILITAHMSLQLPLQKLFSVLVEIFGITAKLPSFYLMKKVLFAE